MNTFCKYAQQIFRSQENFSICSPRLFSRRSADYADEVGRSAPVARWGGSATVGYGVRRLTFQYRFCPATPVFFRGRCRKQAGVMRGAK